MLINQGIKGFIWECALRGFVIGDIDMITAFRLVGVEGSEATTSEEARQALTKALNRNDVAIIIISEEFSTKLRSEIDKTRLNRVTPLIVETPSPKGSSGEVKMSDLVSKTLGIRI
jgi:V/A-type H+/Na+-transporting ATPase subunit F